MRLLGVFSALLIAGLLVGATWVWWLAGRVRPRPSHRSRRRPNTRAAVRRHPAGRERWPEPEGMRALSPPDAPAPGQPTGPDDDPEFISALERLIRGEDPDGLA